MNIYFLLKAKTVDIDSNANGSYDEMKDEEDEEKDSVPPMTFKEKLVGITRSLFILLMQLMILLKMDGADYSWFVAFLPITIHTIWDISYDFLFPILSDFFHQDNKSPQKNIVEEFQITYQEEKRKKAEEVQIDEHATEAIDDEKLMMEVAQVVLEKDERIFGLLYGLLELSFLIMLVHHLDNEGSFSYAVVFIPVWFYFGSVIISCMMDHKKSGILIQQSGVDVAAIQQNGEFDLFSATQHLSETERYAFMLGQLLELRYKGKIGTGVVLFYFALMIAILSSNPDAFSSFYVLLPVFLVVGCCFILCCCFVCLFRDDSMDSFNMDSGSSGSSDPSYHTFQGSDDNNNTVHATSYDDGSAETEPLLSPSSSPITIPTTISTPPLSPVSGQQTQQEDQGDMEDID